jgi:hypothetical protein
MRGDAYVVFGQQQVGPAGLGGDRWASVAGVWAKVVRFSLITSPAGLMPDCSPGPPRIAPHQGVPVRDTLEPYSE